MKTYVKAWYRAWSDTRFDGASVPFNVERRTYLCVFSGKCVCVCVREIDREREREREGGEGREGEGEIIYSVVRIIMLFWSRHLVVIRSTIFERGRDPNIYNQIDVYSINGRANLDTDIKNLILIDIFLALLFSNCFVLF